MFELRIYDYFSSAHNLLNYKGNCEQLHGHNWKVEIEVVGNKTDDSGMLIDFKILKSELKSVLEELDHKYLNDIKYFSIKSPSSENIAEYIYNNLSKKIESEVVKLTKVSVWESEKSCASYLL